MKMTAKTKRKPSASFEQNYRVALLGYVKNREETLLGQAYELGRRGAAEGKSLLEIVALHHQVLHEIASSGKERQHPKEILKAGAEFLSEGLSPYEMAHRGFHDAVKALRHTNETLEEEIKRIAHAVHDEAGQLLVAVHFALAELTAGLPEPQRPQVHKIEGLLQQVENQLRRYSHELRPTILDDLGWLAALRFLADSVSKRTGMCVQVETKVNERMDSRFETALYRLVQEALNNASKHSKAGQVHIKVVRENGMLTCSVCDDGVGFNQQSLQANPRQKGLGLIGMKERLNAVGGTLAIESAERQGTKLWFRFPMEKKNADSNRTR